MPLYEYRCTSCGYSFEKIQSFSAKPETECPKCQGVLIRPVTAPALRFEGAGWYVNDYAGKGGSKSAESKAAESKGTESKGGESSGGEASGAPGSKESKSGEGAAPAGGTPAPAPAASGTPSSSTNSAS